MLSEGQMSSPTSIIMNSDIYDKINSASGLTGKSRSFLIIKSLKKLMSNSITNINPGKLVEYQKNDPDMASRCFHITFSADEYNYFNDMRRFSRKSVSLLVAIAIRKYLQRIIIEILNNNKKTTDNYFPKNYIFLSEVVDDVLSFRIYWGYPITMPEILNNITNNKNQL
jgi:hypothetical protein